MVFLKDDLSGNQLYKVVGSDWKGKFRVWVRQLQRIARIVKRYYGGEDDVKTKSIQGIISGNLLNYLSK